MVTKAEIDRWAREQGLPGQGLLDFLSRTDELLIANLKLLTELTEVLKATRGAGGAPGVGIFGLVLGVRIESLIIPYQSRSVEVIYPNALANCISAARVGVIVNNGLDQAVTFEVIGNTSASYSSAFVISSSSCPANSKRAYILQFNEWMPYVGVQITPAVEPTTGGVEAVAIIQEAR